MKTILIISVLLSSTFCFSEIAIIVHPSNNNQFDQSGISRIFLGKEKSFSDSGQAVPLNRTASSEVTSEFNKKVVKKSPQQLKKYWSRMVFSGMGTPPKEIASDSDMIKLVATNPNMIGYVDSSAIDGSVKVVGKY